MNKLKFGIVICLLGLGCVSQKDFDAEKARADGLAADLQSAQKQLREAKAALAAIEEAKNAVPDPADFDGWAKSVVPKLKLLIDKSDQLSDAGLPARECVAFNKKVRSLEIPQTESRLLESAVADLRESLRKAGDVCEAGDGLTFSLAQLTVAMAATKLNLALERLEARPLLLSH